MLRADLLVSYQLIEVRRLNAIRWAIGGGLGVVLLALAPKFQAFWALMALLGVFFAVTGGFTLLYRLVQRADAEKVNRRLAFYFRAQVFHEIVLLILGIHLSGGPLSPLTLLCLLYIGMLAVIFPQRIQTILTFCIVMAYAALMESYAWGWWQPAVIMNPIAWPLTPGLIRSIEIIFVTSFVLGSLLVTGRARQLQRAWQDAAEKNEFLDRLNELMRQGLTSTDIQALCQMLADQIGDVLRPDHVYIDSWDEGTQSSTLIAAYGSPGVQIGATLPCAVLTALLRRSGGPLVVEDTQSSPYVDVRAALGASARSALALPIYSYPHKVYWGAVLVCYSQLHKFTPDEIQRAQQVADVVALLISHMRLYQEVLSRAELLEEFSLQVTRLTSDLRHTTLLPGIVESARSLLKAQRAALFLRESGDEHLTCSHAIGLSERYIEEVNSRSRSVLEDAVLKEPVVLVPDVVQDVRSAGLFETIRQEGFCAYGLFALTSPDGPRGGLAVYWDRVHAISAEEVTIARLFAEHASDVLRNADLYAQATEQSLTDELTELPNRRALDRQLAHESARAFRSGRPFTLVMMDLDGFKSINDNFGHPIGDSVLQQVAASLRRSVRNTDFVARYGGDEFAIILPDTHLNSARIVVEKLRQSLAGCGLRMPNATQRYISASMGLAAFPVDTSVPAKLIEVADRRLYRAKQIRWGTIVSED